MVEVKGCRGKVEAIRMTKKEWETAEKYGDLYWLAVVTRLDSEPEVYWIQNPFTKLKNTAEPHTVTQVYYSVSAGDLSTSFMG